MNWQAENPKTNTINLLSGTKRNKINEAQLQNYTSCSNWGTMISEAKKFRKGLRYNNKATIQFNLAILTAIQGVS